LDRGRLGEGLGGAFDQAGAQHEGHAPGEQCASLGADEGGTSGHRAKIPMVFSMVFFYGFYGF